MDAGVSGVELSSLNLSQSPGLGAATSESGNSQTGEDVIVGAGGGAGGCEGAVAGEVVDVVEEGVQVDVGGGGADWPLSLAQPPILLGGTLTRWAGGGPPDPPCPPCPPCP